MNSQSSRRFLRACVENSSEFGVSTMGKLLAARTAALSLRKTDASTRESTRRPNRCSPCAKSLYPKDYSRLPVFSFDFWLIFQLFWQRFLWPRRFLVLMLTPLILFSLLGSVPPPDTSAAAHIAQPAADGFPSPEAWNTAEPVAFNTDWQGKNADPELETQVRLLWSDETLYLLYRCRYRVLTV